MELLWFGTASVLFRSGSGCILFDPFVPVRHSTVPVTLDDFDGCRDIFITHGHLDHIGSLPDIIRRNPDAVIRCTRTPYQTLRGMGIPERSLRVIAPGDVIEIGSFTVRPMRGMHAVLPRLSPALIGRLLRSPARGNLPGLLRMHRRCPQNGETLFYTVEADGKTAALMGSLNLCEDTDYPTGADLLVLPYNGWEDNLPPAVRILERLQPKRTVLDHYDDTFPPLTQPLDLAPILGYDGKITPMKLGKAEYV